MMLILWVCPSCFFAAAFHVVIFVHRIENRAIHPRRKLDRVQDLVVFAADQFHHAEAIAIGHDELVHVRHEQNGVRLPEAGDAFDAFAVQVKYFHGLVIFGGEEQALAFEVHARNGRSRP